jgi:DNA-directed RNA polymerase specialized sigma subunit
MNLMEHSVAVGRTEPFTVEQNDEVYNRLVSGDTAARNEMIEGNVALAVFRTDTYLRSNSQMAFYRDDMIGAALVGLCEAVDSMQKRGRIRSPKPTGYITKTIDQHIQVVVDESNTIVVPSKAQQRARAKGTPIQPPRVVSEKAAASVGDPSQRDKIAGDDLHEEILTCCLDDVDRQIVTMRKENLTDIHIGGVLGISQPKVLRRRKAIEERLLSRCPQYKETQRALAKKAAKIAARKRRAKTTA